MKDSEFLNKEKVDVNVAPSCQLALETQDFSHNRIKNEEKHKDLESCKSNKIFVKIKTGSESNKVLKDKALKKAPTANANQHKQSSNKNKVFQSNRNEEDPVFNPKTSKYNHKVNLSLNLTYTKLDFNKKLDKSMLSKNDNKKDSSKWLKQSDTDRSIDKAKELNKYSSKENISYKVKNDCKKEKFEAKYNAYSI